MTILGTPSLLEFPKEKFWIPSIQTPRDTPRSEIILIGWEAKKGRKESRQRVNEDNVRPDLLCHSTSSFSAAFISASQRLPKASAEQLRKK